MSYNQQIPSISYNQQISPMNYQQQIPTTNHHVVQQANSMPQSLPLQQHFPVHHNHNSYILPQISLQLECPSLDSNTLL